MTYLPNVQSIPDANNSCVLTNQTGTVTFTGTQSSTNGFNSIVVNIHSTVNSAAGSFQLFMYDLGETPSAHYTDNYIANTNYVRTFLISKQYYYIVYTSATCNGADSIIISSRLSTSTANVTEVGSSTALFVNSEENTMDAFGRLRATEPFTLLDIRFPGQTNGTQNYLSNNLLVCNDICGNFTVTNGSAKLILQGTGIGWYISQSRKFCTYQPGKSLLFMASGILMPCDVNFTAYVPGYTGRIGYYANNTYYNSNNNTPYNGLYYQYDASGASICIVNNGSVQKTLQSNWNIDQMDGTGPSGLNLQFNKAQLFAIDIEWLGVGRLRFGFFAYGKIQYCHQVTNVNTLIAPYTGNINLPIRYELFNTSVVTATPAYMTQICSTVISEGGYNPIGLPFSTNTGTTGITLPSNATETPILILRASQKTTANLNNNNHVNIVPISASLATTTSNAMILLKVRLYKAENISNVGTIPTWYEPGATETNTTPNYSAAQYATAVASGFSTTGSFMLNTYYCYTRTSATVNDLGKVFSDLVLHITSNVSGQSDYLVITATRLAGTTPDVFASINWVEYY